MPRTRDETRNTLIDAAKSLFHQGFHRTTLADVAAEAGIPLGSLYYYLDRCDLR